MLLPSQYRSVCEIGVGIAQNSLVPATPKSSPLFSFNAAGFRNSPPQPDFGLDTVSDQGDSPDHHRWLTTDCDGPSIPSHVSHTMGAADIDRSTKIKFDLAKLVKIFAGRPTGPVCLADKHG